MTTFSSSLVATFTCMISALIVHSTPLLAASNTSAQWQPQASERLVKLPMTYLKKSIDHDFMESNLGRALSEADENIQLKAQTLSDMKDAVSQAQGDLRTELQHQFLAEKRAYLDLVSDKNEMRRRGLLTKQKLLSSMMDKLTEADRDPDPVHKELLQRQEDARKRFESTFEKVDMKLFETSMAPQSRYSKKFDQNREAIAKLVAKIDSHRMNEASDGEASKSKKDQLREMITDVDSELSLLQQENTIIGYMAKLVALDALALSEQALDPELADSEAPGSTGPVSAVNLFIED